MILVYAQLALFVGEFALIVPFFPQTAKDHGYDEVSTDLSIQCSLDYVNPFARATKMNLDEEFT